MATNRLEHIRYTQLCMFATGLFTGAAYMTLGFFVACMVVLFGVYVNDYLERRFLVERNQEGDTDGLVTKP